MFCTVLALNSTPDNWAVYTEWWYDWTHLNWSRPTRSSNNDGWSTLCPLLIGAACAPSFFFRVMKLPWRILGFKSCYGMVIRMGDDFNEGPNGTWHIALVNILGKKNLGSSHSQELFEKWTSLVHDPCLNLNWALGHVHNWHITYVNGSWRIYNISYRNWEKFRLLKGFL